MISTNCQCCGLGGKCHHVNAPSKWVGQPSCIIHNNPDPRITECALYYPYSQLSGKPNPPPSRLIREGSWIQRLQPPEPVFSTACNIQVSLNEVCSRGTSGCEFTHDRPISKNIRRPLSAEYNDDN